jgi:acyl-ACP thioesterase
MIELLEKKQCRTVFIDDIDFSGNLKPSAFLRFFQDVVDLHSYDMHISHAEMDEKNVFWVINRIKTVIEPYRIGIGDEIVVKTFPHFPSAVQSLRSFLILNKKGELIAKSTSKWCVLDKNTKKIVRCDKLLGYNKERYSSDILVNLSDIQTWEGNDCCSMDKNSANSDSNAVAAVANVGISDLDINFHMNNARYADLVFDVCDVKRFEKEFIKEFDIKFLKETKLNETVVTTRFDDDANYASYFNGKIIGCKNNNFCSKIVWNKK